MGSGASAAPAAPAPPPLTFDFAIIRLTIDHGRVIDDEQVCSGHGSRDDLDRAMANAKAVAARRRARRQRKIKNQALQLPIQPADGVVPRV